MRGGRDEIDRFLWAACGDSCRGGPEGARALLTANPGWAARDLRVAAVSGDVGAVSSILARDPAAAGREVEGWEPLLHACYSRIGEPATLAECGRLLLEAGADANAFVLLDPLGPETKLTPLRGAAGSTGNVVLAGHLLDAGADPNDGVSLFHAATADRPESLELLVARGGDPDRPREWDGYAPQHHVLDDCYRRRPVEWLLDHGADVNLPAGKLGETPLHVATRRRRLEAVELLLDRGADIDARTSGGITAYVHARCRPFDEVSDLLAERGADTSLTAADQLAISLVHGRYDEARARIAADPDLVRRMGPERSRVLADLASQGRLEAVAMLLDAGADVTSRGLDGGTPLHVAAWFCQPDVVRLLIDRGAPIDVQGDVHRSTPLGWAAHGSRFSDESGKNGTAYARIAEMLLDAGASITADPEGDPTGRRFLTDAVGPVAEVLRRHGARDPGA